MIGLETTLATTTPDLARCLACDRPLAGRSICPGCGAVVRIVDGVMEAIGPLEGRNAIVAAFYNGPGWTRFRPWEQAFLTLQGGVGKARREILRHLALPGDDPVHVLEVGIGDGENLRVLGPRFVVHGVDLARARLDECLRKHPNQSRRLAWAEAERLPYADGGFDACYTIGGFNHFRDHEAALREMKRVVKPGSPVIVADELPDLHRCGLGHLIGRPAFDAWWLGLLGLDAAFVEMVLTLELDLPALFAKVWPGAVRKRIWHGLGYCYLDRRTD